MNLNPSVDLLFQDSDIQFNFDNCKKPKALMPPSQGRRARPKRLARHATEADREKERLGKIAERERTRVLLEKLDPLVPLTKQPAPSSRGSLRTKRTLIDLYEDAIAHLQSIRCEDMKKPSKRMRDGACHLSLTVYREGLMMSDTMLCLELLLPDTRVVRASRGLEQLYLGLTRANIAGEKFAHFFHPEDLQHARAHLQATGMLPLQFVARVIAIDASRQGSMLNVRFDAAYPNAIEGRMVYMLSLLSSPSWTCSASWDGLSEVSGVYELVSDRSTSHYLTDCALNRVGAVGGFHLGLNAFGSCEMSSSAISRLMSRIGATYSILSRKASGLLERIAQVHYVLDLSSEIPVICIHVRLRLPNVFGTFKTPWSKVLTATCDGSPADGLMRFPGTAMGFLVHRNVPGQLSVLYYKRDGDTWRIFHHRLYRFNSDSVTLSGEVFTYLGEDPFPYSLHFRKVEEADRTILAATELS
ncbi:hypothetical protein GUITHDRAFT_136446 [Guillardia theta CCMP2712]|uniref:PAS domain-containing protein n=2 Tax=Guillardia theta TaxID=55529 RepID=L1JJX9_GUITC|nr:hypothetical protein GUITHDRAFT_136446 [Guillardia theta CCMP2712]EKX48776.1 hypothetical protein GUITHDRAFT_136446 [Guillardia theta CCMP2712]|eukprot:XP_005835756.1 hypothetical protein GUITHDRAFT_136446 [Guillardia theta CCMP2712]